MSLLDSVTNSITPLCTARLYAVSIAIEGVEASTELTSPWALTKAYVAALVTAGAIKSASAARANPTFAIEKPPTA